MEPTRRLIDPTKGGAHPPLVGIRGSPGSDELVLYGEIIGVAGHDTIVWDWRKAHTRTLIE